MLRNRSGIGLALTSLAASILLAACGEELPMADCMDDSDCAPGFVCNAGECEAMEPDANTASCTNGQQDGAESDVDCGGGECSPCIDGRRCTVPTDCASFLCEGTICQVAPTCSDETQNGNETDVDCGGDCRGCDVGQTCTMNSGCASGACEDGSCVAVAATCSDLLQNGNETDVDCGGSCEPCAAEQACMAPSDCASGVCTNNVCTAPDTCTDGGRNNDETDVDCGGSCEPCGEGSNCSAHTDCAGICVSGTCAAMPPPGCGAAACNLQGAQCGRVVDACGDEIDCGGCGNGHECGQGGTPFANQCRCRPRSCSETNACGRIDDGCGVMIDCSCGGNSRCFNGQCCQPRSCQSQGAICDSIDDGCGGTVNCGSCSNGTCVTNNCRLDQWCANGTVGAIDYNGDGRSDLYCRSSGGNNHVIHGRSNGFFDSPQLWSTTWCTASSSRVRVGDFNGDGRDDFLCHWSTGRSYVIHSDGTGGFGNPNQWADSWCTGTGARVGTGDFDGDGRDDLYCHGSDGRGWVRFSNGNGDFVDQSRWTDTVGDGNWCSASSAKFGVGDFNGDGRDDFFCHGTDRRGWVIFSQGRGQFGNPNRWTDDWCSLSGGARFGTGDFNGDGRDDFFCHGTDGRGWTQLSQGNGTFQNAGRWTDGWCAGTTARFGTADFNKDNRDDFFCHSPTTGRGWVMFSQGNGDFGNPVRWAGN